MVKIIICLFTIYVKIQFMSCHENFEDKFFTIDMSDNVGEIGNDEIASSSSIRIKRQTQQEQTGFGGGMGMGMGCCQRTATNLVDSVNPMNVQMMQARMECQQNVNQAMMGQSPASPALPGNTPAQTSGIPFQFMNLWKVSKSCTMSCIAQKFNLVNKFIFSLTCSFK